MFVHYIGYCSAVCEHIASAPEFFVQSMECAYKDDFRLHFLLKF